MKWIKHYTDSRRDPILLAIKREMGFAGVGMFWALVEAIGEQYESNGTPELELDLSSWRELTGIPPQSFRKLTENLEKTYRKLGKSSDFSSSFSKKTCKIFFGKIKDIRDNYTRDCQVSSKPFLKSIEEEKEIEKEKINTGEDADASSRPQPTKTNRSKFFPPTVEEVSAYCLERDNSVNPEQFVAFYESNGWKVGKNKMKNWKMAVVTWEGREQKRPANQTQQNMSVAQQWASGAGR